MKNINSDLSSASRREFIASFGAICAGLLTSDTLAGLPIRYQRNTARAAVDAPGKALENKLAILSAEQMKVLRDMVEVIIPATDTLGAAGTDTHGFIDDQLSACSSPEEAKVFIATLDKASLAVRQRWGKDYWALPEQTKIEAMTAIATGKKPFNNESTLFFKQLKALTTIGYYTSEEGARKELVYLPIPGGYDANFKLKDNGGKAFSIYSI